MKVNLLKTKIKSDAFDATSTGFGKTVLDSSIHLSGGPNLGGEDSKNLLTNFLIMAIFSFGAYYYSGFANKKQMTTKRKLQAQITNIEKQLKDKEQNVKKYAKFKGESDEFKRKIMAIKELSQSRLIELKALDYIQNIVPEKVWFTDIKYKERIFNIKGKANENEALTEYLKEMEKSPFFVDILILKAKEVKDKKGSFIEFEVQSGVKVI